MFKKFFYACAAILCLALAFHLGATNAQGQSPSSIRVIGAGVVVSGETLYEIQSSGFVLYRNPPPVTASSLIFLSGVYAITSNGQAWIHTSEGPWLYIGQVPGDGATTVQSETWSSIKSKFK